MKRRWPPPGTVPMALDVVSVQSQVIYGRVGNNVAMPTLAALGLTAAAVPTVLLSNTPHYPSQHGGPVPLEWFAGHLDDLHQRGALTTLRAVVCGYLGSAGQAAALADWIAALRTDHPALQVIVDPVIGDNDHGIYVAPELVEVHKSQLMAQASGLTPNSFELSALAGTAPDADLQDTIAAARSLLHGHMQWVIVTSAAPGQTPAGTIQLAVVRPQDCHIIAHPEIAIAPKGTGDLFAASLSGHLVLGESLLDAATAACARVLQSLRLTAQAHCAELLLPPQAPDPDFSRQGISVTRI